jgi:alanine racemase
LQATKAIIHLDNLRQNIDAARKIIGPHPKICLAVKADGYGHGAGHISLCALEAGVEYLSVAGVSEAAELRAIGITAPVLLLSQAQPEELGHIASMDLMPLVSDSEFIEDTAEAAERAGKKITVHLKIDTGMGRLGCHVEDAVSLASKISSSKDLSLGGVATHLSVADSLKPEDISYTKEQLRKFKEAIASIKKAGIEPGIVHAANSGALVFHEDSYFDMVRPGLFLYGYLPAACKGAMNDLPQVEPVMELQSKVVFIKKVKKGSAISYARTWVAPEDTFIGIIPAGYADGFPWKLSNNHSVCIRGKSYPLVGQICMDQCIVNLGPETEVKRWDTVVLFGPGFITAADMAEKLESLPYEIFCGINKRVPREYVESKFRD